MVWGVLNFEVGVGGGGSRLSLRGVGNGMFAYLDGFRACGGGLGCHRRVDRGRLDLGAFALRVNRGRLSNPLGLCSRRRRRRRCWASRRQGAGFCQHRRSRSVRVRCQLTWWRWRWW